MSEGRELERCEHMLSCRDYYTPWVDRSQNLDVQNFLIMLMKHKSLSGEELKSFFASQEFKNAYLSALSPIIKKEKKLSSGLYSYSMMNMVMEAIERCYPFYFFILKERKKTRLLIKQLYNTTNESSKNVTKQVLNNEPDFYFKDGVPDLFDPIIALSLLDRGSIDNLERVMLYMSGVKHDYYTWREIVKNINVFGDRAISTIIELPYTHNSAEYGINTLGMQFVSNERMLRIPVDLFVRLIVMKRKVFWHFFDRITDDEKVLFIQNIINKCDNEQFDIILGKFNDEIISGRRRKKVTNKEELIEEVLGYKRGRRLSSAEQNELEATEHVLSLWRC